MQKIFHHAAQATNKRRTLIATAMVVASFLLLGFGAQAQGYYWINGEPALPSVAQLMAAQRLPFGYYWLDMRGNFGVMGSREVLGNIYTWGQRRQSLSERGTLFSSNEIFISPVEGRVPHFEYNYGNLPSPQPKILETGYSLLKYIGGEEPGYGLYSYAILINDNGRSAKFLGDMFNAIPAVEDTAAKRSQTNIFYIPLKNNKEEEFKGLYPDMEKLAASSAAYATTFYDYKMSRAMLNHLCESPAKEIKAVCEGDLSRGPFIFTYAGPASKVTPVPPPFLFMDLSDVHERAFPEIIAAFKAQVKRDDISDRAKIDTLRLKLLSIVLTGADWVAPAQKAIADVVHSASGQSEKDKK